MVGKVSGRLLGFKASYEGASERHTATSDDVDIVTRTLSHFFLCATSESRLPQAAQEATPQSPHVSESLRMWTVCVDAVFIVANALQNSGIHASFRSINVLCKCAQV